MTYDVQKAAEILGTTVEDVEENIKRGTLTAEWKDGRWEIPEWSIRVFVRTRETLRKLNRRSALDREESEYELLGKILAKLDELTDFQKLQLKWIEQIDTLRFRIHQLEEELREKVAENVQLRKELAMQRDQSGEELKKLREYHEEMMASMRHELARLHEKIAELEEMLRADKSKPALAVTSTSPGNTKDGFWDRLVRMLTWD